MKFINTVAAVGAGLWSLASAQQYAGENITTNLPSVPGSEIAYFKVKGVMDSNKNKPANLTLINYYSHGKSNKRLVESNVQRAVVIIHGLQRDPGTYESNMLSALSQVTTDPNINPDTVAIMSPYFPNGDDKTTGYPWTDGLKPQRGSTSSALVWKSSQWSAGGNNQYPYYSQSTSSYDVLDQIIQYFDDTSVFPNMKQIVISGHSLGAQMVHRYAAIGKQLNTKSPVTLWIGNPNSYVWLSTDRPLSKDSCADYDDYREGYTNFDTYPMTYGLDLVNQGRNAILANYQSKQVAYGRGTRDMGDDSSTCAPGTTGINRNERFFNFIKAFPPSCPDPAGKNCDTVDFVNVGHDAGGMFASPAGQARLFKDNFYGNGNRSYDFGYPRQQTGDDPFPDPNLSGTGAPTNGNTYAGNMTYAGCYSDSSTSRSLNYQAYANSQNTIELCTSTCNDQGYTIAGLEFGTQCMCGNALTSQATTVVESSCTSTCPGNSSEICGGGNRLSIFSNGPPTILVPPSTPDTIGAFSYSNCYTEGPTGTRALSGKSTSGSFMTLEYCANYCSGFKYFGTEYASECYCGNSLNPLSNVTAKTDCSMTCASNELEYCGAGNRLTIYTNPDATGSTPSSSAPGSTPSSPSSTGPSCPGSDGTTVVSNGLNFTVECGIDHSGGDLTSLSVSSFQGCIDACSSNPKCVDVSLSGSACYLKSTLGAAVNSGGIWGAKLASGGSSSSSSSSGVPPQTTASTTASSVTSSTVSSASSTASSSSPASSTTSTASSTISTTSTPTALSCPASDGTIYTSASGKQFLIECGIDHQGGDLSSLGVSTFQQCVDACDAASGCVDVSLSGAACYLKSNLGAAVPAGYVWGAKLVTSSSLSTTSSTTSSAASSTTASSTTASSTTASSSTDSSTASSSTASSSTAFSSTAISSSASSSTDSSSTATSSNASSTSSTATPSSTSSSASSTLITSSTTSSAASSTTITSSSSSASSTSSSAAPTSTSSSTFITSISSTTPFTSSTATTPSPTPSAVSCPASNNTLYTLPSGSTYLIECGIDHAAGDLSSKSVTSFAQCIAYCDSLPTCVDVSLSGAACYAKSKLGAAKAAGYVWGAKRVTTSSTASAVVGSATGTTSTASAAVAGATGTT